MSDRAPDARFPWAALLVLSGATFVTVTTELLPASLLLELATGLHVTAQSAGLLVAVWALTVAGTSLPLVRWTAGVPRSTLLPLTLAVFAGATAVTALAPSYAWALAGRVVAASAHGVFWSLIVPTAGSLVAPARAGRAVSVVLAGPALAGVVGIPLGAAVGAAVGWRVTFGALALLLAVAAPAVRALRLPDPPPLPPTERRRVGAAVTVTAAGGGLLLTAHFALYTYVAPLLQELGGYAAGTRSLLLLVFGLAGLGGIALSGPLSERHPRSALPGVGVALVAGVATLGLVGAGLAVAGGVVAWWGLVIGLLPPVFMTRLLRAAPPGREAVAGAVGVTVLNLGIAAGAAAGGAIVDHIGVAALPPAATGLAVAACAVLLAAVHRRSPRSCDVGGRA